MLIGYIDYQIEGDRIWLRTQKLCDEINEKFGILFQPLIFKEVSEYESNEIHKYLSSKKGIIGTWDSLRLCR